jgi:single-strand DNA-binding protein
VSRSLNKVMLIGNLGKDPEVRSTSGGNRVASFSMATGRSWTGANGEKQEKTEWHKCVVWNSKFSTLADIVERYQKKGDRVYVEGRIEYRQYQDKDNQTRYVTEINVRDLVMLSGRDGSRSYAQGEEEPAYSPGARSAERAGKAKPSPETETEFDTFPSSSEDDSDDLPF